MLLLEIFFDVFIDFVECEILFCWIIFLLFNFLCFGGMILFLIGFCFFVLKIVEGILFDLKLWFKYVNLGDVDVFLVFVLFLIFLDCIDLCCCEDFLLLFWLKILLLFV